MMKEKTTLQDIAKLTGVTVGTVHKALNNSKGVSEKKRDEILALAQSLNYIPVAKHLAPQQTVVALFPEPIGEDRFFYQFIWAGIAKREEELSPTTFRIIKISFDGSLTDQKTKLEQIYDLYHDRITGLITIIWEEDRFLEILNRFTSSGIKIFTISADAPGSQRTATVMANPYKTGRLAAEYIGSVIEGFCRVIIMGTKRDAYNHAQVVRGFFDQMSVTNPRIQIIELYESREYPERLLETLNDFLTKFDDICGIYANNARTTARILDTIRLQKEQRRICVVGSEIFRQSISAMQEGTLNAVIDQNAFQQAYEGVSTAFAHLVLGKQRTESIFVPSSLYLQNNLPLEYPEDQISTLEPKLNKEFGHDLAQGMTERG